MRERTPIFLGVVLFALALVSMSMYTVDKPIDSAAATAFCAASAASMTPTRNISV